MTSRRIAAVGRGSKTLIAALALAMGLAACGGGSGSSATEATSQRQSGSKSNGGESPAKAKSGGGEEKSNRSAPKRQSNGSTSSGTSTAHSDSGGGATQFQTKGGDNSIQQFGGEGGESELEQAAVVLHAYLDARAAEEWKRACDNMASGVTESLQQLAGGPNGTAGANSKKLGCPQILSSLSAGLPPSALREAAQADVGALRIEGERAFLLYHGAHNTDYFMPMSQEGERWKVAAIAASALP